MDLVILLAGASALAAAWLPGMIRRLPFSLPVVFVASGILLYLLPIPLPVPDPV